MGYAILRLEKRHKTGTAAMLRHALRERAVANALGGGERPLVLAGETSAAAAGARLDELLGRAAAAGQRLRRDQVTGVDVLVTLSPADADRLGRDGCRAYLRDALQWIRERWPSWQLLTAAVHTDETTPHLQALFAPTAEDGHFRGHAAVGGPRELQALQDAFHASVGAKYGLERGVRGSRARHVPVRTLYGAMSAGEAPPRLLDVPPAPSWRDRLLGRATRIEARRKKVLEHNKNERERILQHAKVGRMLHPALIERQSKKYRDAVQKEAQAAEKLRQAAEARDLAISLQHATARDRTMISERLQILGSLDEKSRAQLIDRITAYIDPHYVNQISKNIGVALTPGRALCDQIRRAGLAHSLIDAAELIDRATRGEIVVQAQRAIDDWDSPERPGQR